MKNLEEIKNFELALSKKLILELIGLIDLTSLNPTDTSATIETLCRKANQGFQQCFPAAVCAFPIFADQIHSNLKDNIKTAVVGGAFPTGVSLTKAKINEVDLIEKTSTNEIDIVINRGFYIENKIEALKKELIAIRKSAKNKTLKIILETGDFTDLNAINQLSDIAISCGADFIKTSTGKSKTGATPEAVYTMCLAIKKHYTATNKKIGIKPSGGIRTPLDALLYYRIVEEVLGKDWLTPNLFRIGASSLYDELINEYNQLDAN